MDSFKVFPPKSDVGALDYLFDWAPLKNNRGLSNWLREGEVITDHTVTVSDGITKISDSKIDGDTAIVVWLDEGSLNSEYQIECYIETNQARKDKRTAILRVVPR